MLYFRFGAIPASGKSQYFGSTFERNTFECGVSVFGSDAFGAPILNTIPLFVDAVCRYADCDLFCVEGEVCGVGHDGEPCLKNARIVSKIKKDAMREQILKVLRLHYVKTSVRIESPAAKAGCNPSGRVVFFEHEKYVLK